MCAARAVLPTAMATAVKTLGEFSEALRLPVALVHTKQQHPQRPESEQVLILANTSPCSRVTCCAVQLVQQRNRHQHMLRQWIDQHMREPSQMLPRRTDLLRELLQ